MQGQAAYVVSNSRKLPGVKGEGRLLLCGAELPRNISLLGRSGSGSDTRCALMMQYDPKQLGNHVLCLVIVE